MKKIVSIILCIAIGLTMLSPVIYGNIRKNCEIYSIGYTGGICEIFGRIFSGEGEEVNLTATSSGSTVRRSATSASDGSFVISFPANPDVYSLSFSANGRIFTERIDLSFINDLINGIA